MLAFTSDPDVVRQLPLVWGVRPPLMLDVCTSDFMIEQVDAAVREAGVASWGDLVVVVLGVPSGETRSTNQIRVHRVERG